MTLLKRVTPGWDGNFDWEEFFKNLPQPKIPNFPSNYKGPNTSFWDILCATDGETGSDEEF